LAHLLITAVGPDRPGLVQELSGFLTNLGANIADARMINLRGRFAVILSAEADDAAARAIREGVAAAGKTMGLEVSVTAEGAAGQAVAGVPFRLKTYSMDQPGIVHRITHLLHRRGVNIEELQTRLEAGAHTGTPLFTMDLRMTVPRGVSVKGLRDELESLCDSLNCDVDLEPA
jgi:glycine cleavage system transcriptional repressor